MYFIKVTILLGNLILMIKLDDTIPQSHPHAQVQTYLYKAISNLTIQSTQYNVHGIFAY